MQLELNLEEINTNSCLLVELSDEIINLSAYSNIVYADAKYNFIIETNAELKKDENISIYVNNENCIIENIEQLKNNKYRIKFKNNELFNMIFGLTNIILEIDGKIFYSNSLAVAFKNTSKYSDYKKSIELMLKYILSKEHSFFNTGKYINNDLKNIKNHKNIEFENEIKLFEEIIEIYHKNYNNFLINPYTKASNSYTVEKIEKLSLIDSKTLQYIAENPENLRFSNIPTGLIFNKLPITPIKSLVKNVIKNIDIYENQQILGFLVYLLNYINDKIKEIESELNKKYTHLYKENLKDGYDLPINIINLYSNRLYDNYHKKFIDIKQKLLTLKVKYLKCFPIQVQPIKTIPRLTPIFSEIFYYNNIFSIIKKWFSHGEFKILNSDIILNFPSADKIYELYSIINIYEYLYNAGYKEIAPRQIYRYFKDNEDYYFTQTKIDNTFEFQRNDEKLYLYYQPVIHCNCKMERTNNISLCRVDEPWYKKDRFYIPDIIIKKAKKDRIQYAIFDSKWSSITNLKRYGGLRNCIYKYYSSIVEINSLEPVSYMWLLSGKSEEKDTIYRHRNSIVCKSNIDFCNQIGIVALNPETDDINFRKIMDKIIMQ